MAVLWVPSHVQICKYILLVSIFMNFTSSVIVYSAIHIWEFCLFSSLDAVEQELKSPRYDSDKMGEKKLH